MKEISFEEFIDSADYYASKKQWRKAEEMTVKALQLKPANKTNWLLWSNLAEIREKLDDTDGALTAYDIGLSIQPQSKKMLMGRASLLLQENRENDALKDLNEVINIDSLSEWSRMIRGMILLNQKKDDEAEKDFTILKAINKENPQSYSGLALIEARRGNIKNAISLYSKSIEILPDESTYFYLITLEADSGMLPEAAESLREAMKRFPRNGNLFLLRAYIHKLNFQNEEADIALKLAKEYGADQGLTEYLFSQNEDTRRRK